MSETEKNVPNVSEMLSNERIFANLVELILQVRNWQLNCFCVNRAQQVWLINSSMLGGGADFAGTPLDTWTRSTYWITK